jgi:hypothetical protein
MTTARVLGILFAAAAASLLGSCWTQTCTLAGCGYAAEMELIATSDGASLEGGSVRVCLNAACVTSAMPERPSTGWVVGDTALRVGIMLRQEEDGVLTVTASVDSNGTTFVDGDVYTAEVLDATGGVLASRAWTAQYGEDFPNGESCGPSCPVATLTALPIP